MTDLSAQPTKYLQLAQISFEHSDDGETVWLNPNQESVSMRDLSGYMDIYAGSFPVTRQAVVYELSKRSFIAGHELSEDSFLEDHWQTLFAIQYPEARS